MRKDIGRKRYFTPLQAIDYGIIDKIVQPMDQAIEINKVSNPSQVVPAGCSVLPFTWLRMVYQSPVGTRLLLLGWDHAKSIVQSWPPNGWHQCLRWHSHAWTAG